ncbi:DUF1642 domain-containing protein [Enterococcus hirae]
MNKQELIDKYTAEIAKLRPYCPNRNLISEQLKYDLYKEILDDLEQLDEPQKPVVLQFVADWFEENKDNLEFAIWELCVDSYNAEAEPKIIDWIQCTENKPIETLIRMKDGYEVEKEPLYCVKIGKGYFSGFDDTKVTYVIDDAPGALAQRVKYETREEAEMDAIQIGGTVEEVAE